MNKKFMNTCLELYDDIIQLYVVAGSLTDDYKRYVDTIYYYNKSHNIENFEFWDWLWNDFENDVKDKSNNNELLLNFVNKITKYRKDIKNC